jgi:hypothetical protein
MNRKEKGRKLHKFAAIFKEKKAMRIITSNNQ